MNASFSLDTWMGLLALSYCAGLMTPFAFFIYVVWKMKPTASDQA